MSTSTSGFADEDGTSSFSPGNVKGVVRLEQIRKKVQSFCEGAHLVVIESYFVNHRQGASAVIPLAELGGVVRLTLHRAHIPFVDVAPTRLKQFATGKGTAGKSDMILAAYKRGKVEFTEKQNDECDAWWLRQMGCRQFNNVDAVKLPQAQVDVLKGIDWPEVAVNA